MKVRPTVSVECIPPAMAVVEVVVNQSLIVPVVRPLDACYAKLPVALRALMIDG
jgi:hypothetical protein